MHTPTNTTSGNSSVAKRAVRAAKYFAIRETHRGEREMSNIDIGDPGDISLDSIVAEIRVEEHMRDCIALHMACA